MLSFAYNAVQLGGHTQTQSLLAYGLSLINGCGTHKINICGHSFFQIGACEFTNIIIVSKQTSIRKNL